MSPTTIVLIFALAGILLVVLLYVAWREIRVSPRGIKAFRGLLPIAERLADLDKPPRRPWRVLVAVDGSPCSDRALQSVASRPWPAGSEIEVISVVHTRVPTFPDPELMIEAAHVDMLAADRERAPIRVLRAERCLSTTGIPVRGRVLEGNPETAIIEEAERWNADLIVVGSHGFGPLTRVVLGSTSNAVALHAHRSVEIVRCPHADLNESDVTVTAGARVGAPSGASAELGRANRNQFAL
jgi:nucleotide-binding universal stress UspA family protein